MHDALPESIEIVDHDPAHREQLSYLGANERGEAMYVNRRLFDADVVLPIGCVRHDSAWNYYGISGTICPTFADSATIERFRVSAVDADRDEMIKRRHEAYEMARLVGVLLTTQVVPGAADEILHVLAGSAEPVQRCATALSDTAWNFQMSRRAELIVAAIAGGPDQQTWENVGRAIAAASQIVSVDGAIALCTELNAATGPALQTIVGARDLYEAQREIRRLRSPDVPAAFELARALQHCTIYLLSELDDSIVEDLGMAPVSSAADLARLARRHSSCIVLGGAQYAYPATSDEIAQHVKS